jgi:cytochrome c oxidase subunit II
MTVSPLVPEQASTLAPGTDALLLYLLAWSAFFVVTICGTIAWFIVRYRRGPDNPTGARIGDSNKLEAGWIAAAVLIALSMFGWSAYRFVAHDRAPANTLDIFIIGKQWMWRAYHPEGQREINELHVPVGQPVKLLMTSQDVIHSFFIPAFRIKQDVLPGRFTSMWFEATRPGTYHLFCAEYCGSHHARMVGRVIVVQPEEYEAWLESSFAPEPMIAEGRRLFYRYQCASCHNQAPQRIGPDLTNLFGRTVRLASGDSIVADEDYFQRSIYDPAAEVVAGYEPLMPTYRGQLDADDIGKLAAYVRSLEVGPEPERPGPEREERP